MTTFIVPLLISPSSNIDRAVSFLNPHRACASFIQIFKQNQGQAAIGPGIGHG